VVKTVKEINIRWNGEEEEGVEREYEG